MSKVDSIVKIFANNTSRFVQKPNLVSVKPSELKLALPLQKDVLNLSSAGKSVSVDDVKAMFPTGKLNKNNFLINSIKDFLKRIETKRKIIDLNPKLSDKDYNLMKELMNLHDGKYIDLWKGYSNTDTLANKEKLALFVRTMRLTRQGELFLKFNPAEWDVAVDGIVKKPKQFVNALLEYKYNSKEINEALSDHSKLTPKLREYINAITEYLKLFETKNDIIVYRGDKSFDILQTALVNGKEVNLTEVIGTYTKGFQLLYKNNRYNKEVVNKTIKNILKDVTIKQSRFMSTAMDKSGSEQYAKKILWTIKVPKGTKGTSIESFNVERLNEAEFLGQRDGIFRIKNAAYNPEENLWCFDAIIEQDTLTNI